MKRYEQIAEYEKKIKELSEKEVGSSLNKIIYIKNGLVYLKYDINIIRFEKSEFDEIVNWYNKLSEEV